MPIPETGNSHWEYLDLSKLDARKLIAALDSATEEKDIFLIIHLLERRFLAAQKNSKEALLIAQIITALPDDQRVYADQFVFCDMLVLVEEELECFPNNAKGFIEYYRVLIENLIGKKI